VAMAKLMQEPRVWGPNVESQYGFLHGAKSS
jgi:hypothetical protein